MTAVGHDITLQVTSLSLKVGEADAITADFDANSLRVTTEAVSVSDRKKIERNAQDTLETRRHPNIGFRSVSVERNGDRARIEGDLTLHGVTAAISVEARDDGKRWHAKIILDQRKFGIKPFSAMLGALKVKPDIEVDISIPHL
ncbi:MAG: YceI family protein [Pseudonocardiaceae bacterium]